jgi:hypothetical protein
LKKHIEGINYSHSVSSPKAIIYTSLNLWEKHSLGTTDYKTVMTCTLKCCQKMAAAAYSVPTGILHLIK